MPRKSDPQLQRKIVVATRKLLEERGVNAVSMRAVATAAATTTPTVYERFRDRDQLMDAVIDDVREELLSDLQGASTMTAFGQTFIRYFLKHPHAFELMRETWPARLGADLPKPAFELAQRIVRKEFAKTQKQAHQIALAGASLLIGAVGFMLEARDKATADALGRTALEALSVICKGM